VTDLDIRKATKDDVPAIVALLADDLLGEQRESPADLTPYLAAFDRIAADPHQHLLIAFRDGQPAGTLQLTIIGGLGRKGTTRALIEAVRVRSDLRGHGLGSELILDAIDRARREGARIVQLTSDAAREEAHRFYERLGFVNSHAGFKLDLGDQVKAGGEAAWFATLPTMYGAAAALFTDEQGRVLLVKPNYRDHWSLPGGILEHGEPPAAGCAREVAEELGLSITPGDLLTVDWVAPEARRPRPIVHWIFDGGTIPAATPITLQAAELDDYRFVDPADVSDYVPPVIADRVAASLRARKPLGSCHVPIDKLGGCGASRHRRGTYLRARL